MRSDTVKKGYDKAPHRALLRATGLQENDFGKPFIAIVNSYVDIVPGHVHLQDFGKLVKGAVRAAGGVPFEFNTIGVDDGIAMGHMGMKYSLPSRELIADSVETMIGPTDSTRWSASRTVTRLCRACCWPPCELTSRPFLFQADRWRQGKLPMAKRLI